MKFLLYPAALIVAVSSSTFAQTSMPYGPKTQCKQKDNATRICLSGDNRFVEITQPDFQVVTGMVAGELVTCVTWGLSSVRDKINLSLSDVDQICVWGVGSLPGRLPKVQRSDVL